MRVDREKFRMKLVFSAFALVLITAPVHAGADILSCS